MKTLLALIFTVLFSNYANAGLIGNDINFQCPECGPPVDQTFTAVPGGPDFNLFDQSLIDVEDNSLKITWITSGTPFSPVYFVFSWDATKYSITNATIDDLSTLTYDFAFTSNTVNLSLGGVYASSGDFIQINLEPVSAVPVPAAVWLFGSGLILLTGIRKKSSIKITMSGRGDR